VGSVKIIPYHKMVAAKLHKQAIRDREGDCNFLEKEQWKVSNKCNVFFLNKKQTKTSRVYLSALKKCFN